MVIQHRTRMGESPSMCQNPHNAIIHTGHNNGICSRGMSSDLVGTVSLWSPNMTEPLVKMLCHRTSVSAMCVDMLGRFMVTGALDNTVKVWDLRTYKCMVWGMFLRWLLIL